MKEVLKFYTQKSRKKEGQVWVETVLYTLVALIIIGMVLSFVTPKIEEIRDRSIVEQSIVMMENINGIILSLEDGGQGNKRLVELGIQKGLLIIDSENDRIVFELEDSASEYSEPGEDVPLGDLTIRTRKIGSSNKVSLIESYFGRYNITYNNEDQTGLIPKATTPYRIFISNEGLVNNITRINFELG